VKAIRKSLAIAAPVHRVWAALTAPSAITAWMGGPVRSNPRPGGRLALFAGETTGRYTLVQKPARLEYTWRQGAWPADWPDSRVRWTLKPGRGGTRVTLTHDRLPNQDERDSHAEGWDVYWLEPMRAWLESSA
jgi:uncharacterized protein YndB with AHSA1/START domain